MNKQLDSIHHIAIEVTDIQKAIDWYQQHLKCEVAYQDDTWGLLKFENISVALVLPGTHPPHIGIPCDQPEKYGEVKPHRDGTSSAYIQDPFGNWVEMIKLN
ncbi:MAG: Glyoxalase/bleomycin resistance protein/dioxygenase [Gammaproteobacteria bacterium]|jgi:catechol 2,3-dioxygenase-like lactoylglutathione lyase family enzyme|nr:Glyoxalase/bleomycin resistance protein/dioxygenase [Gammaproteobacteria bacterium]